MKADKIASFVVKAASRGKSLREAHLLRGAYLSKADLREVDLRWSDLNGVHLSEAKGVICIGPIGSRGDYCYFFDHGSDIMVKTGCFFGSLETFLEKVRETHGDNRHARAYRAACEIAVIMFK